MTDMFCAVQSEELGEGLWGTAAAHVSCIIALEVREPWGRKAVEEAALGPRGSIALQQLAEQNPGLRIQLIRRPEHKTGDLTLYAARTGYGKQGLWRIPITGYDDLASINWAPWLRGEAGWLAWRHDKPVYLVCVHGKRDRCCAERGMPVYSALRECAPDRVWQTSHLGGHRFAATLVTLPDGVCFGRVAPEQAVALYEAREAGRIYDVSRVRGRMALAGVAQAAECAIRERLGALELFDMRMEELAEDDAGVVRIAMRDDSGGRHEVALRRRSVGSAPPSCGAEPADVYRYEVVAE